MRSIATMRQRVRDMFEEAVGAVPDELRVSMGEFPTTNNLRISHFLLDNTLVHAPGIPDGLGFSPGVDQAIAQAIADYRRRAARLADFAEIKRQRTNLEADRPWSTWERPPSWTLITHPLLKHGLMANGTHDVGYANISSSGAMGVRMRQVQDMLFGTAPFHPGAPAVARTTWEERGAVLQIATPPPDTVRVQMPGLRLDQVISVAESGDAELDATVRGMTVASADIVNEMLELRFAAETAMPAAAVPEGVAAGFHGRDMPAYD